MANQIVNSRHEFKSIDFCWDLFSVDMLDSISVDNDAIYIGPLTEHSYNIAMNLCNALHSVRNQKS